MLPPKTFQPLLTGPAERVPALCPDEEEGLRRVMRAYRGEPYCLVSKWVIVELDVEQAIIDKLHLDGLHPCVLFARRVIYDSRGRYSRENYVLTSPLKWLDECYFVTQNTVYVLIGGGERQRCKYNHLIGKPHPATNSQP
ncbi:DUF6957 family protein [Metapseudomonas furukawaii]|uniref:DUF6957 family protein n=2 Tax=Metapseudomonas furukawaii TaxID=1149133 RepID=UPI0026AB4386